MSRRVNEARALRALAHLLERQSEALPTELVEALVSELEYRNELARRDNVVDLASMRLRRAV